MDYSTSKSKGKKGLISKTWERCKSFSGAVGRSSKGSSPLFDEPLKMMMKSKSFPRGLMTVDAPKKMIKWSRRRRVTPEGCFSIYVGPEKQRFVIKTEYVNHPLFKTLLEEAESEYGYSSEGPLVLPCEVDHFLKVLMQMDFDHPKQLIKGKRGYCKFVARSHTSYHLLTPPRFVPINYIYNY